MGPRGGTGERRPLVPLDAYGRVLAAVLLAVGWTIASPEAAWSRAVTVALFAGTVFVAFRASGVRGPVAGGVLVALGVAVVAAVLWEAAGEPAVTVVVGLALVLASLGAIVRRLAAHPVVTTSTVAGALTVYLLVGMLFTFLFATIDLAVEEPILRGVGVARLGDFLYHSFITLTTVGYGDVAPGTDAMRAISVLEALIGQLYLVTIVAVTVARMGTRRRGPEEDRSVS